ncbi:MAG: hypothetical protein IJ899_07775 [Blautia sp.]|nr:hypothetical protein [Blautia sp.]
MRTTFISRIFRYIVPWTAFLFLITSLLFFYYQAQVFVDVRTSDIEVIR